MRSEALQRPRSDPQGPALGAALHRRPCCSSSASFSSPPGPSTPATAFKRLSPHFTCVAKRLKPPVCRYCTFTVSSDLEIEALKQWKRAPSQIHHPGRQLFAFPAWAGALQEHEIPNGQRLPPRTEKVCVIDPNRWPRPQKHELKKDLKIPASTHPLTDVLTVFHCPHHCFSTLFCWISGMPEIRICLPLLLVACLLLLRPHVMGINLGPSEVRNEHFSCVASQKLPLRCPM